MGKSIYSKKRGLSAGGWTCHPVSSHALGDRKESTAKMKKVDKTGTRGTDKGLGTERAAGYLDGGTSSGKRPLQDFALE